MTITYLFSKNNKIGSYLIRLGSYLTHDYDYEFNNVPSHVAILIDNTYVIESIIHDGVRIIPYNKWLERNTEIKKIETNICTESPRDLMFEMWGKSYDKLGLFYFAICILDYKLCKTPIPEHNIYEQEDKFFCTEFASRIFDGNTGSMRTPLNLMYEIERK